MEARDRATDHGWKGEVVKRIALIMSLLASGFAITAPVSAANEESLYDLLIDLGTTRADSAQLIGDATGLAAMFDNCDTGAPQYTMFLPAKQLGRGALLDVLVDNSGRPFGQLLARPALVKAFVDNHVANGLISESKMVDPSVTSITMRSGETMTKTSTKRMDGSTLVTVNDRVVVDGIKTIGQPNGYSACNGVVYIIDGFFNPRGEGRLTLSGSGPSLYDRIVENSAEPENPLQMLIDAAGLGDNLRDCREEAPPVTLFLPGPGAVGAGIFVAVLATLKESLGSLLARPDLVKELIENHIVDGLITPDDLLDPAKDSFTARSGLELLKDVGTRPDGTPVVYINGHEIVAGITSSRMGKIYETCSGALYFIDGFLSPERALAALTFAWRDAGKKWGDNRFRFGVCNQHLPWRPSCVTLP